MRIPSLDEIKDLAASREGPHVSIYLPVETAGRETRQNTVRLKNLLRKAEDELVDLGHRRTEVQDFLQVIWQLEDNSDFWQERQPGLGILLAPGVYRTYWLPKAPEELLCTAGRFRLTPLVELVAGDQAFYLLAISMNDVRFFHCTRFSEQELTIDGLPRDMAEALWPDDPERQQQFRSQPVGQASGHQGHYGVFHGSGDNVQDDTKDRLLRYFHQIDRALEKALARSRLPLVLAAVDYLHPIYAEANSYRYLAPEGITGNPDDARGEELRHQAWKLLEPKIEAARRGVLERFRDLVGAGRATSQIKEIVAAADQGRVDSLLYESGSHLWGVVLSDGDLAFSPERRPGDEDLVDHAVVETVMKDGSVVVFERGELGEESCMAAVLRY